MENITAAERAESDFLDRYCCSQSLLRAFAPRFGLDLGTAARIAAPFGGGIGHMGWTCGAVTGALMVIGLKFGYQDPADVEGKERGMEITRAFLARFQERNGSTICRELLGVDLSLPGGLEQARAAELFKQRCPELVRSAAEIVEAMLDES